MSYDPVLNPAGTCTLLPSGAAGTTLTAGAAWVDGAYGQIDDGTGVPATAFKIVGVAIDTPSAAMIGEIGIAAGAGAAEVEIGRVGFEIATDAGGYIPINIYPCGPVAASTRLACNLATAAGAQTLNVKLVCVPV